MRMTTMYNSIFLKSDQRKYESLSSGTIRFTQYANTILVMDVAILPRSTMNLTAPAYGNRLILPIVGNIIVSEDDKNEQEFTPEHIYRLTNDADKITVHNPNDEATINFLLIGVNTNAENSALPLASDLQLLQKNTLAHNEDLGVPISIGVYDGRIKSIYRQRQNRSACFIYVLNGCFEVEERLMGHRDGLLLWETDEIDYESLSNTAILLIIECSPLK
jgi:quercetin 2,3-dioxygenase